MSLKTFQLPFGQNQIRNRPFWDNHKALLCQDINQAILLLATSSGERRLTNVLHLAELVQAKAMSMDKEHAVIRWFVRQLETPDAGADEGILRLESDEKLVKVVTVHKSKGLEYPLVFQPFICSHRKPSTGKSTPVTWHDDNGHRQVGINPGETALSLVAQKRNGLSSK